MHTTTSSAPSAAAVTKLLSCVEVVEARRMAGSIVPAFETFDHAFAQLKNVSHQGGMRFDADPVLGDACVNSTDLYAYLVGNEARHPAWAREVLARVGLPVAAPEPTIAELQATLAAVREDYAQSLVEETLETRCCSATDPVVLARVQELVRELMGL